MRDRSVIVDQLLCNDLLFVVVSRGSVELFFSVQSDWRQQACHDLCCVFQHHELCTQLSQTWPQENYPRVFFWGADRHSEANGAAEAPPAYKNLGFVLQFAEDVFYKFFTLFY